MPVIGTPRRQAAVPERKPQKFAKQELSKEDKEIVTALEQLKIELDDKHNNFNYVTDPTLVDSYIYEIMSLHMKYKYYLDLCKAKGLVADGF